MAKKASKIPVRQDIDALMKSLESNRVPTLSDLAQALVEKFGGSEGLAAAVFDQYEQEATPPNTKAKLLSDVLGLVRDSNKLTPPETETDEALGKEDDVLQDELAALIGNVMQ